MRSAGRHLPLHATHCLKSFVPYVRQAIVAQIVEMGFPRNRAEKAAVLTNNESAEAVPFHMQTHTPPLSPLSLSLSHMRTAHGARQ